jgi:transcriptional regulator with XRE-family HTH domain
LAPQIPGKAGGDQISKWERGIHLPHEDTVRQIGEATGNDFDWFYAKSEKPAEKPAVNTDTLTQLLDRLDAIKAKLDQLIAAAARK